MLKHLLPALILFTTACSSSTKDPQPDAADAITADGVPQATTTRVWLRRAGGDLAVTQVGGAPITLTVVGVDELMTYAGGAQVRFSIRAGTGLSTANQATLSHDVVTLDGQGRAEVTLTPGEVPGMVLVQAVHVEATSRPVLYRCFVSPASTATKKSLHILAINDFHMRLEPRRYGDRMVGGLARIAHVFQTIRDHNDALGIGTLIVNAGDDFENTLFHNLDGAIPELYRLYDAMGVDVTVIGNHDYHFGMTFADDQVEAALPDLTGPRQGHPMDFVMGSVDPSTLDEPFAHLAAHFETDFTNTDNSARYDQTLLYDIAGIKVGVIGVVTDAAVYTQVAGNPSLYQMVGAPLDYAEKLTFFDPDPRHHPYINSAVDALDSEGADIIVVASHAGLGYQDRVNIPPGKDEFIAKYALGPDSGRSTDILLSGHSHVQLNQPIPVNNPAGATTWIGQAREAGEFVASWMLEVDTDSNSVTLLDYHLLEVDDGLDQDPEVKTAVKTLADRIEPELGIDPQETVAELGIDLSHRSRAPAGLGRLLAHAFLNQAPDTANLDAALVIPSIYRADLWQGTVTASEVYDVVPLHELDNLGTHDERLVIWETRAGRYNCSIFGIPTTQVDDTTIAEYILEAIHSIGEVLEGISPGMGKELNLEVMQFAGLTYQLDGHGESFHKVVPGSVRIGGDPVDHSRSYRLAMVHSIGVNLAYVINFIVAAKDVESGEQRSALILQGNEKPYEEIETPAWQLVLAELKATPETDDAIPATAWMTGEELQTVEPDLTCNPMDIAWSPEKPTRGAPLTVDVTIRNFGTTAADDVDVALLYESTPWDRTDDDDGRAELEGLGKDFLGSLVPIATTTVDVPAWPDTAVATFQWDVPEGLPPYAYPLVVRISAATNEVELGNNAGPDQRRRIPISLLED